MSKPRLDLLKKISLQGMKIKFPLSADQESVLKTLVGWLSQSTQPAITVGGYAGTGKTTLIGVLRQVIKHASPEIKVAFACYTGKASQVLMTKLKELDAVYKGDTGGTIHSLMYNPETDKQGRIVKWVRNKQINQDLIIVDEGSMVDEKIWKDLLSYGIRIVVFGDHGQLPPIEGRFNLMANPDLKLEKIHRQAEGNKILTLARMAREDGHIPVKDFSATVRKLSKRSLEAQELSEEIFNSSREDTLIICGYNKTRIKLNQSIRGRQERTSMEPMTGDRVVCVRNIYENPSGPIYNGMIGYVDRIMREGDHWYTAEIYFPDEDRYFMGNISKYQFDSESMIMQVPGVGYKNIGERFDFGYALTVHKAQGSQANRVLLFEENFPKWDRDQWKRWLYTAVTRAVEELYIIGE